VYFSEKYASGQRKIEVKEDMSVWRVLYMNTEKPDFEGYERFKKRESLN